MGYIEELANNFLLNYLDAPTQGPTISSNEEEFKTALNKITAGGGKDQDCPENTLEGNLSTSLHTQ